MKQIILIITILASGLINNLHGQVSLPYFNNFDNPSDTTGWSHYSISGTDNWELGTPNGTFLNSTFSPVKAWATNLSGNFTTNSIMCLETPFFDFSDTTLTYKIGFSHQIHNSLSSNGGNVEYSVDTGQTWHVLNGLSSQNYWWYDNAVCSGLGGDPAWSNSYYSNGWRNSFHALDSLEGQPSVKFRFKFGGNSSYLREGWVIDNFSIEENLPNVFAVQPHPFHATEQCPTFEINTTLYYWGTSTPFFLNVTNYYWSIDSVFDTGDSLIGSKTVNIGSQTPWNKSFTMPPNVGSGVYYIFYMLDADSNLLESNESDNLGTAILVIDSIHSIPIISHFDDSVSIWETGGNHDWQFEAGFLRHLDGAHSGEIAWNISNNNNTNDVNYIETPPIDLSTQDSTLISFWFRSKGYGSIRMNKECISGYGSMGGLPVMRDNTWDFYNVYFPAYADTAKDVRVQIRNSYNYPIGTAMVIDDIYIGKAKPDLSVERFKSNRFSSSSVAADTLKYYLNNSGLRPTPQSYTNFYWSNDSILDSTDLYLGTKLEQSLNDTARVWTNFAYTKPTNSTGKYYIFYILDTANVVDEMREYNNTGYFTLYQENALTLPYFNDFESQINGWRHNASFGEDEWKWATPNGIVLDSAFSGVKAWITIDSLGGSSNGNMHLYTPIFDLSASTIPVIEFDMNWYLYLQTNGGMNMSYSTDGGASWQLLDTTSQSFNRWYYPMGYSGVDYNLNPYTTDLLFDLSEPGFTTLRGYNSRDVKRNTRYIVGMGFLGGIPEIRFRFNLGTINSTIEGVVLDNFTIREAFVDLNIDYKKALMISSNANKIKFFMHIKNQGNYISSPSITKYYVSADTVLDASDYYLGQDSVRAIRPDMYYYVNKAFIAPSNLSNYNYLLYKLDETNTNLEANETNNIGFWPLALDSVKNYPYFNNFNDSIIDGWHQFSIEHNSNNIGIYRFRSLVVPAEPTASLRGNESGEWATEKLPSGTWQNIPYLYLESPVFDFSGIGNIILSFDLMCTGKPDPQNRDGGNFEFSINGGNTWTVLTSSYGQGYHWYNQSYLQGLSSQPGWSYSPSWNDTILLDSTSFNASFLAGEKNVVFRFKYKSNWETLGGGTIQGMRVDNFRIEGFTIDYVANDFMQPINATLLQPYIALNYSITNSGQSDGDITKTKFYWSNDSVFDPADLLIQTVISGPVSAGTTEIAIASLAYPTPITQAEYYIFYIADGDSTLVEANEFNNVGSFKITFPPYPNYVVNMAWDTVYTNTSQSTFNVVYSIINSGSIDGLNSTTAFYWSVDSVFDVVDQNIHMVNEAPILLGDTLTSTASITYPTPITQINYYLYYTTDYNDSIVEMNEGDNVGAVMIVFDTLNSITDLLHLGNINMYVSENYLYIITTTNFSENSFSMKVINTSGQMVYQRNIELRAGENKFILPNNLASGIYLIHLQNENGVLSGKVLIEN